MHRRAVWAAALVALTVLLGLPTAAATASAGPLWIGVHGNRLVDRSGHPVRLLGVNRSGAEYMCLHTYGNLFDGPVDRHSIRTMKSWHINAVRVPLNETCWLGINGTPRGGPRYRREVAAFVHRLNDAGLYVVLDIHVAAPGSLRAKRILPMPDASHAPDFWRSVATRFNSNHALLFDLYNEPHDIGWPCWLHGCRVPAGTGHPAYRAAGMQQLVDAVRSTGATQPVMVGGVDWSRSLGGWLAHSPHDPAHSLVASEHNYGRLAPCHGGCQSAITRVARHVPVVVGELGETDCAHGYIDSWMRYADRQRLSYLGWTWNATAPGSWTCRGGPSLIKNWAGDPTPYGIGFKRHLAQLAHS
jgi:hypothetical protein